MNTYLLPFTQHFLCYFFRGCLSAGDISPPRGVKAAMEMQAEAERKKRAQILESEGNQFDIPTHQMSKDDITLYHPEISFKTHVIQICSPFLWLLTTCSVKQEKGRLM